jgi:hypothetical protein
MGLQSWILPQRLEELSSMGRHLDHSLVVHKWRGLLLDNYGFEWLDKWEPSSTHVNGELNLQ